MGKELGKAEEVKIFPKCKDCGSDIDYRELLDRYGPEGCYHIAKRLKQVADEDVYGAINPSSIPCKHDGRKRSDPLGGFFCVECATFINKKEKPPKPPSARTVKGTKKPNLRGN